MMYDEELAMIDLVQAFKDSLNTEITKINTEKGASSGDDLFLKAIPTDEYISQTLNNQVMNFDNYFLMYAIEENPISEEQENNYSQDINFVVEIGTYDNGEIFREQTLKKLLRYRRALRAVVFNAEDIFRGYAKAIVGSLKPARFPYPNGDYIYSSGITVKASFTAN